MRKMVSAAVIAVTALGAFATPGMAQSRGDQQRWDAAQARYQAETERYFAERDRWVSIRSSGNYGAPPPPPPPPPGGGYADERDERGYDPAKYYRPGQERVLEGDDRVYGGYDGRTYCKRSDGTTGLVVGGAAGGILGNVIDGGRSRTAGTLLGAAVGALAGRAVDQNQAQLRCR